VIRAWIGLGLLVIATFAEAGCSMLGMQCSETPTTSRVVSGQTLWGKGDGDVLFDPFRDLRGDRVLVAGTPEKMRIVLANAILPATDAERIPSTLDVVGRNMTTGTSKTFTVSRQDSDLGIGVEWGTNLVFPDGGCWELRVSAPRNEPARIVVKVART
jgi:hypothetical protein